MASKKKLTLRQQYQKQITRVQKYQKRYEKLGYKFEQPLAPELPKRVTRKKLQEIQQFKPRKIKGEEAIALRGTGEILAQYEPEPAPQPEEPVYGYVDEIEKLIKELPEVRYLEGKVFEVSPAKDELLNALWDTLAEYDNPSEYEEYLSTVYEGIQMGLTIVELDSKQHKVEMAIANALRLIQKRSMTMGQGQNIANYQEYYGYNLK